MLRLARARGLLAKRLACHGLVFSGGALAVLLSSASMALARGRAVEARPTLALIAVSHTPALKLPAVIAHAAGHKIA